MTLPKSARDELARLPVSVVGPPELLRALPALLQSAEFAEKATEFLREWGALLRVVGTPITVREQFVTNRFETELAELLRSLPLRDPTDG